MFAKIAQLVERHLAKVEVAGSNPVFRSIRIFDKKPQAEVVELVEGDSMLPNIRPNDWVLGRSVSNVAEASDNKIYIVVLHDSVLVKKLEKINHSAKIRLLSLNQEYLPIEVNINDIQELWQVNSKLTFGIDEPSESTLLKQLQQSMDDLKGQINRLQ